MTPATAFKVQAVLGFRSEWNFGYFFYLVAEQVQLFEFLEVRDVLNGLYVVVGQVQGL